MYLARFQGREPTGIIVDIGIAVAARGACIDLFCRIYISAAVVYNLFFDAVIYVSRTEIRKNYAIIC